MIAYNQNIPNPPNPPSSDVATMQSNAQAIQAIWAVDHLTFGAGNDGQHKQVSFPAVGGTYAPTYLASVLYTKAGVASTTTSNLIFQNANFAFPLGILRAWGVFNGGGGGFPLVPTQSANVKSITRAGAGAYVVTLTDNAVSSSSFGVLVTGGMTNAFNGVIIGVAAEAFSTPNGSFQINARGAGSGSGTDSSPITFLVLQI